MHLPVAGGGPALAGLLAGGSLAWALVYGFAAWLGIDPAGLDGRRLAAVAVAGAASALVLYGGAVALSGLIGAVSRIDVPVWLSLWVVAGPLGLLLTLAYHDQIGGDADPAQWLGLGALAGFAVWPVVEYLAVLGAVALVG